MSNIERILDRNRRFADTDARRNVPALPILPRLNLYVISCIDCRVDPAQILSMTVIESARLGTICFEG